MSYFAAVRAAETAANWMYHGTTKKFDNFKVDVNNYMIDRAIGVHFAADVEISNNFASGLYDDEDNGGKNGRIVRLRAPPRSKVHVIKQNVYGAYKTEGNSTHRFHRNRQTDQNAVGSFVAATVFKRNKDMFVFWITRARGVNPEIGEEIYDLLVAGKAPAHERFGLARAKNRPSLRSYIENFDPGLHGAGPEFKRKAVREFDYLAMRAGIDALIYQNTSPSEVMNEHGDVVARSTKCYIILNHAVSKYTDAP